MKRWLERGTITFVSSSKKMQTVQARRSAGVGKNDIEHFEPYGLTSHPPENSEAIIGFMDGDASHGVALVIANRSVRIKNLQPGEVAIFTDEGDSLVLKRGNIAELTTKTFRVNATESVEINSPVVKISDELIVSGELLAKNGITARGGAGGSAAKIEGTLTTTGDITVGGKSVLHHHHQETGNITGEME